MNPRHSRWLVLGLVLALGAWLRLEGLTTTPLFGDEHHSLKTAAEAPATILRSFDRVGSHVLTPLLQHASRALFGPEVWTLRLVAVLPGLLALLLVYPIGRRLVGEVPALMATAWLAVSPMHVFYSRFGRPYALVVLGGLLVVLAGWRVIACNRDDGRGRALPALVGLGLACALTLYVHLSTAGLVAAVGLVVLVSRWRSAGARGALAVGLALAGAGLLAFLLYLPVLEPLREYLGRSRENLPGGVDSRGPLSWFELPLLLGGGVIAGGALAGLCLVGLVLGLRRARDVRHGWLCTAAIGGPLVLLLLMRPFGMGYAYARYLIVGLPFLLMLAAAVLGRLLKGREGWAPPVALLLAAGVYLGGPLAPWLERGTFSNTYLALQGLPAFDEAWPGASPLYGKLAQDDGVQRVIELPLQRSRTVLLYRNHQRTHGKRVLVGVGAKGIGPLLEGAPYVHLDRPGWIARSGAQWLIVHRRVKAETERYWQFVYRTEPTGPARGLLERNRRVIPNLRDAAELPGELGPPDYQDEHVLAWRLTPGEG
jgi:Dolichyl-phosphate-mannose-protein mannosyltransferase